MLRKITKVLNYFWLLSSRQSGFYFHNARYSKRFYIVFTIIILCIFSCSLYIRFSFLQDLKNGAEFSAKVINQYSVQTKNPKNISSNIVVKDNFSNIFSVRISGALKNLIGRDVRIYGKVFNCSLLQMLSRCKLSMANITLLRIQSSANVLKNLIEKQHYDFAKSKNLSEKQAQMASNFYNALFLAFNLNKDLRQSASALGIAHIIAISGMHLAVIALIIFVIFMPIYRIFHTFYPFRNAKFDMGILSIIFLALYLILIDYQASFFRAFFMFAFAFFAYFYGFKILNFSNLFLCIIMLIAFIPNLLFDIGFLLSISGVLYIFLYLKYAKYSFILHFILFPIIIFLQMMIIVHFFFPFFSFWQIISIPLSIIFAPIFFMLFILHLIGFGYIFDSFIFFVTDYDFLISHFYTPLWLLIVYVFLSLFSIFSKKCYILTIIVSIIFYIFNAGIFIDLFYKSAF